MTRTVVLSSAASVEDYGVGIAVALSQASLVAGTYVGLTNLFD